MTETTLYLSPAQLREIADLTRSLPDDTAREIREIADRVEADGSYSVVRPAYRVTWRLPPEVTEPTKGK